METYIPYNEVCKRVGKSRCTIARWVARGEFPAPVLLGPRHVAFRLSDLEAWDKSLGTGAREPVRK